METIQQRNRVKKKSEIAPDLMFPVKGGLIFLYGFNIS